MSTSKLESSQLNALVTGSSNGIGEAIVKKLAKLNYKLVVTGRNRADISRVADECQALSPSRLRPLEIEADLSREDDVDRLFKQCMEHFEGKLHLLVNNAGLSRPVEHSKADECYQAFKQVMQVNLNSAVRLTLLASRALKDSARDGWPTSVVFVSSAASQRPTEGLAAYSSSKAALTMFAKSIASELGSSCRVNSLEPGPVATKIIERAGSSLDAFAAVCSSKTILGRIGLPDEVAEAVLFLADNARSGFITGTSLVIDGGVLASPIRWSD